MINKKEAWFLGDFALVALVLLVIASIWDLPISRALMDQNSIYGVIFQAFGMFPQGLIGLISSAVLFVIALKKALLPLVKGILAVSALGLAYWSVWGAVDGWMFYGTTMLNNIKAHAPLGAANNNMGATAHYSFVLEALITLVLTAVGLFIVYRWLAGKDEAQLKYLTIAALAGLAVIYLTSAVVSTMKTDWGRFRPYEVSQLVAGAKASFTNWWQLNGVTGHQSFPSGHELAAMTGAFLPFFVDRRNVKLQKILAYTTAIYGGLMAFARVRVGAHFLSDVTVSAIIVVLIIFIIMKFLGYSFIEDDEKFHSI